MARIRLSEVVIDCPGPDPRELQGFYQRLTGFAAEDTEPGYNPLLISPLGYGFGFQPVESYQGPVWPTQDRGQQIHLDFHISDPQAATAFAEAAGATLVDDQPGDDWIVMLDPAGHPFCLAFDLDAAPSDGGASTDGRPAISWRSVSLDCPDNEVLSEFYRQLLGLELVEMGDEDHSALVLGDGLFLAFQRVDDYQSPTWPTQERGQQMHLDLLTDDIESAVQDAISLGARPGPEGSGGEHFRVMLDPAGHPFCLCNYD